MQVINFIDSTENVKANLFIDSYGRVEIKFLSEKDIPDESILLSGFIELNEHNYICQSDFKDMRYLYCKKDSMTYMLTNDPHDIYNKSEASE